jgi:DNA-binding SARP family transcriptional activator
MAGQLPVLSACMFGRFRMTYGDSPLSFGRSMTKVQKLLLILLYSGEEGIARNKLLEDLYGREDVLDAANNLRVTSHRLKKMLKDAGLPEYDYVTAKNGIYYWTAPMETQVDALQFEELVTQANQEPDEGVCICLLKQACEMYSGEFLQELSGEEWVLMESLRYKSLYTESLLHICSYLKECKEYEEILRICSPACEMYPFDEWQSIRMECYIAMKRYKDAFKEYENTEKLFFEELGISPSEKMMAQLKSMGEWVSGEPRIISKIKENLKEDEGEEGAFYCSLPSFRDEYRFVCRVMERSGQSMYLMLCTVMDEKGYPMEDKEKLEDMSEELYFAIRYSLRRCDSFTRYSPAQFLLLLVGTNMENCSLVSGRIAAAFSKKHRSWRNHLDCYAFPVADLENETSQVHFTN